MGNLFGSSTAPKRQTTVYRESADIYGELNQVRNLLNQSIHTRPTPTTSVPTLRPSTQANHANTTTIRSSVGISNINSDYRKPIIQVQDTNTLRKNKELCSSKLITKTNASFILEYIDSYAQDLCWEFRDYSKQQVYFIKLHRNSSEYRDVEHLFKSTNKRCFQISKIERIQNPFLLAAFLLKLEEMENKVGEQDIEELFHGTRRENVMKICTDNLDYRLYGQNTGNKYGQGISFTPISNYATHYGNEECDNRVMLLVHVLVGEECIGRPDMILPDEGTDTSIKENRQVIVKYGDNEFYPAYKITYTCTDPAELQRRAMNNQAHRFHKQRRNQLKHYSYDYEY